MLGRRLLGAEPWPCDGGRAKDAGPGGDVDETGAKTGDAGPVERDPAAKRAKKSI